MAVQYVQEKSGLGSLLGGLATIGGALTGQSWLSALGTGINMMSGNGGGGSLGGYEELGKGIKGLLDQIKGWANPADGSIVDSSKQIKDIANKVINVPQINDAWQKAMILANQSPYNRSVNNMWGMY